MTIRREGSTIHLDDVCTVEQAETLTTLLDQAGDWTVDMSGCRQVHTALIQVLLRYRPALDGTPADPFLCRLVIPALTGVEA